MKTIHHPVFMLIFTSYVVYYVLKHTHVKMPEFVTSYFADVVSLFIINTVILFLLRKVKERPHYELPIAMVIFSFLAISIIFEWIQPALNERMVADTMDIFCYALSASTYIIWRKNWKLF